MPLMFDNETLDVIGRAVAAECTALEHEGLLTSSPLLTNIRTVGGDMDLREVAFVADMRSPLTTPWTIVEGHDAEVQARIHGAVERAMGLG